MKIEFHPGIWEDLEKMPPEEREQVEAALKLMQQAAANLPEGATEAEFSAELARLGFSGGNIQPADLPDDARERLRGGFPTKH